MIHAREIVLMLSCGFVAACSGPKTPPAPGDPAAGERIYASYCYACHQTDGSGVAANGVRIAADYTDPAGPLLQPDEALLQVINTGRTGSIGSMPPWRGVLSSQQQRDVLAYLRWAFAPPPAALNQ
ncbi:MAG: cytochrome c [Planctomycetota bacterium]|nr:cytochrome c [Planctomycetota bacterium]